MKDPEIRSSLRKKLSKLFAAEPDTLILDELGLCSGQVRADVVVVNGYLAAYEIKSANDTFARLDEQIKAYNRVFDRATIVVGACHVEAAAQRVPEWWGIQSVRRCGPNGVYFREIRLPRLNPAIDPRTLAQLLWRDEAAEILTSLGLLKKSSRETRRVLWDALAQSLPLDDLRTHVRMRLQARPLWRSGQRRRPSGGTYRPFAMS